MGKPINKKIRSAFGERVKKTRLHAQLTQHALAKALGTAQSTIAEMEWTAESSGYTAQIADICKVSPGWLATGKGNMLAQQEKQQHVAHGQYTQYGIPSGVAAAIETLRLALIDVDSLTREQAKPIIDKLWTDPENAQDLGIRMAKTLEGHNTSDNKKKAA
jgi:transcriptional regulator with XRE-family HTH domain